MLTDFCSRPKADIKQIGGAAVSSKLPFAQWPDRSCGVGGVGGGPGQDRHTQSAVVILCLTVDVVSYEYFNDKDGGSVGSGQ